MTICSQMYKALDKRLEEKKSLDDIGSELCDAVDDPRGKAIRLIKTHKGEQYLKDNAEWLGYNSDKAVRTPMNEKIRSEQSTEALESDSSFFEPSPPESKKTGKSDNFEPDEIVRETTKEQPQDQTEGKDCCVYEPVPLKEVATICPCGCGYGYYDGKFYSSKQLETKHV